MTTTIADTVPPAAAERIEGLTAWRAVLMLGGLPLHAIHGDEAYAPFAAIALTSASFRMGAFFMISGLLAGFALLRRADARAWLRGRLACLGIPTLFALAVICPAVALMVGHPVWAPNLYHIWFLLALVGYTLIAAALHRLDGALAIFAGVERRSREARRLQVAMLLLTGLAAFTLMALGRSIHAKAPAALHPATGHLHLILGYAPAFLLGFAAARAATLRRMLTASQRVPLAILAVALAAHGLLRSPWIALEATEQLWWADLLALAAAAWCPPAATVVILRSAMAIRHVPPVLHRLADASFTIYLLHFPIIVATKVALRPSGIGLWTGFALAMLVGGVLSYAFHRLVVRRVPLAGVLLGNRPAARMHRPAAPSFAVQTNAGEPRSC